MPIPAPYIAFWAQARRSAPSLDDGRFLEAFAFGDGEAMASQLAQLVLAGTKRATASLWWAYESTGRTPPKVGDLSIVTTWDGEPLCVIETTAVDCVPFDQVSEAFAAAEGEADGTLASWRRDHQAFFTRECRSLGGTFTTDMLVLCERFRVAYQPQGLTLASEPSAGAAPDDDLPPLPSLPPGRYRHYKGGEYQVLGVVRHSESLEPLVLYRPLGRPTGDWVRPYAMFVGSVVVDGQPRRRFTLIEPAPS